jgi:hypothetical protein
MKDALLLPTVIRTLLSVGFQIVTTEHKPSYIGLIASRIDDFGVKSRYLFACSASDRTITEDDQVALQRLANHHNAALVVIGSVAVASAQVPVLTVEELLGRLGGPVKALLPLEPGYPEALSILGHNELPPGFAGKPDTIFEEYVHAGLEFTLQDRVVRYGQERLFEALPDGLVAGHRSPLMMYDAKAAKSGYEVTANSIRQFGDYVRTFHSRYESYTGRLFAFVLVSGHFETEGSLEDRCSQLFADCGVPLRTLTAEEMARIVALFADRPRYRGAIDWRSIFSKTIVTAASVEENLEARKRDGVIQF